jgi:hypothetical protein
MAAGALRRKVVPGEQVFATFAIVRTGSSAVTAIAHASANRVGRFHDAVLVRKLISAAQLRFVP